MRALAAPARRPAAGRRWKRDYPDLFPNAAELEADWFKRTGIYPMHGTIVVKDSVLAEHPWVAKSLFNAFSQAKNEWLARLDAGTPDNASDKKYAALRKIVGRDPLPYGMDANCQPSRLLRTPRSSSVLRRAACRWMSCSSIPRRCDTSRVELSQATMIIDCHGHFTTAPKSLHAWRKKQLERSTIPPTQPKKSDLVITDDEIRGRHRRRPAEAAAGARRRPDHLFADRRANGAPPRQRADQPGVGGGLQRSDPSRGLHFFPITSSACASFRSRPAYLRPTAFASCGAASRNWASWAAI